MGVYTCSPEFHAMDTFLKKENPRRLRVEHMA